MGQRTATLVCYIDKEGKKHNHVYYHQWGIGRLQIFAIMGNFFLQLGEDKFDLSGSQRMSLEDESLRTYNKIDVKDLDFTNINDVKKVYDCMDNNNGGIVVVWDDKNNKRYVGYILGPEEVYKTSEKPYTRFVSFRTWRNRDCANRFLDKNFVQMYQGFLKYFGFKELTGHVDTTRNRNVRCTEESRA